ncbi:MAG TPA: insulinase family protein [Thermoanaerobaculia bacterium]|nr:insulinase family protein [Thermoanaerobaculia bacterium]HQR67281.1 insulinase family protein [Thermoanaerobaculia bacterium]
MNPSLTLSGRRLAAAAACALLLAGLSAPPAAAQELKVQEKTLSNGMKLLLLPRKDEPAIACGWVAHVGSVNERPGITGISHLFEHMMFKGTPTIGTKDAKKDLEIIEEQEKVQTAMREEVAKMRAAWRRGELDDITKPENKTARYRELEKRFDELVKAQRELLVKEEFERTYAKQGGSGSNAFTTNDMTGYFVTVPKNKLELWMWMESDRLRNPVFREFYAERDVVYEERRRSVESTPTGKLEEAFEEIFWHSSPYAWPVIGYPSDLPAITKAQADDYYATYYAPNNVTGILVGDFDPAEAAALAERYFGRIPRGKNPPPEVVTATPKWDYDVRMTAEAETNPEIEIRWHTVPFQHKDSYALEILAGLLNGRTGRLDKALVLPADAVATKASASAGGLMAPQKYAGAFSVDAEAKEGRTLAEVEKGILAEIEKLKKELVPAEELQKVKNNVAASSFRRLASNFYILLQLVVYEGYGDWREMNEAPKKEAAVTAEDVRRVANTYLTRENQAALLVTRKGAAPAEDPEIAALPEAVRPMVKQSLARIASTNDPEPLKKMIEQMEARAGQMPPEMKKASDLVLARARARLEALSTVKK